MNWLTHRDWHRRLAGLLLAMCCVGVAVWALVTLLLNHQAPAGQAGILGVLLGLLPLAGVATRLLTSPGADLSRLVSDLAEEVATSELSQRTQLLGGDNQPINVGYTLCDAPSRVATGAAACGTLADITTYYRRLQPQRLLITGGAGAGKTVLALELMLGLLEDRQPDDPVPVRFALSSWDPSVPLESWLAKELADTAQLSKAAAARLVEHRRILPVLDGLDEMDPFGTHPEGSRAARALTNLNSYQSGRHKAPLVLTCRTTTYDTFARRSRLLDAARVQLDPVGPEQAEAFLTARALDPEAWRPVINQARNSPGGTTAALLSTPWLLTLAVTVYEADGDPAELLALTSQEDLRDHLLRRFVPAATELRARSDGDSYPAEDVERWLGVLARYLADNIRAPRTIGGQSLSGTDLVPHRLWPLAGTAVRVVDTAISGATGLIIIGLLIGVSLNDPTQIPATVALGLLLMGWILIASRITWPTPKGTELRRLRTRAGRQAVIGPVTVGFLAAAALSLATALPTVEVGEPIGMSLGASAAIFMPIGLICGLAFGLRTNLERLQTATSERGPVALVRADLRTGLVMGFTAGAGAGIGLVINAVLSNPTTTYTYMVLSAVVESLIAAPISGALVAVVAAPIWAGAWRRYIATLLCTRKRLPWRLGRFLTWAYRAGLLRISGTAYQFRHQELQDHLAKAP